MLITNLSRPRLILAFLLLASVIVGWQPLRATFLLALHDDQYTHVLLILPLSIALIVLEWPSVRDVVAPSIVVGSTILGLAIVSVVASVVFAGSLPGDVQFSARMFALVLFWIGSCVLCLGSRVGRALVFPLCFLFWLVPIPQVMLSAIIHLLQEGSTLSAHWLFAAFGIPVSRDGFVLTIPGLSVEVAQECSSIRSSSMLLVTTMVLAQVLLRSVWRKVFLVAVAVPLSVAKNGLRIFVIAMLGTRVNPSYLTGRLHRQGGPIFFAAALAVVFCLIWVLKRGESRITSNAAALRAGAADG
jgi:exosortase